jgi:hypothetical protein
MATGDLASMDNEVGQHDLFIGVLAFMIVLMVLLMLVLVLMLVFCFDVDVDVDIGVSVISGCCYCD